MFDDFDLMDALPCGSDSDKVTYSVCVQDEPAEQEQSSVCEMKIQVVAQSGHDKFHKVANLVLKLYKMKVKPSGPEFALEDRLDERPCGQFGVTSLCGSVAGTFKQCGKNVECSLFDCNQRILVRKDSQALQLQATHPKENMDFKKVTFNLEKYVNPQSRDCEAVSLWIAGSSKIVSCTRPDDSNPPILKLEKVNCEQLMSIEAKGETARFLFFRRTVDFNNTTFESVKFPGWLIRSSSFEHKPVEMCKKETTTNFSRFKEK
ncbi:interleukin-1 beta isoform X2 [Hypomesus transpacificus]|uniref:interleukin-1 beta isoform X2 n=1 Tax=Hypomesus transpacificus TaxID=137520 RepID=UPI001F086A2F|nr:interleukin-1 beta isoform X2 [Hypomesus transpacificus]